MKKQLNTTLPLRLLNTPLMVNEDAISVMLNILENKADFFDYRFSRPEPSTKNPEGVAVIPIFGGLTYRGFGWFSDTSYLGIRKKFREALTMQDVKYIVFDIDSPGGEVAGVFDLVDEIYNSRGKKPIYAVANETCFSAAYAIASAADKVFLSRTAVLGSVGVMSIHVDMSKQEENEGVKYTPIFAGARKNDFSPHAPLSKQAYDIAQASVNKTYNLFVATVARNRGLSEDAVRKTEAGIFQGRSAVEIGMADEVLSLDLVIKKITKGEKMEIENLKTELGALLIDDSKKEQAAAILSELGFSPTSTEGPVDVDGISAEAEAKGKEQATKTTLEILELCSLAGMVKMGPDLIKEGVSVEDARKKIIEAKSSMSDKTEVRSTVSATSTGEVNPLLQDAIRRAGKEV